MSKIVQLPEGHTALVRGDDELRGRDRDLIKAAAMAAAGAINRVPEDMRERLPEETDEELAARITKRMEKVDFTIEESLSLLMLRRASVIALLQSWDRPEPVPTTVDELADLPGDLYDALLEAVAPAEQVVTANETNFDPHPGKENPTGSSTSSVEPSPETPSNQLTEGSTPDGENTPTESSTEDSPTTST